MPHSYNNNHSAHVSLSHIKAGIRWKVRELGKACVASKNFAPIVFSIASLEMNQLEMVEKRLFNAFEYIRAHRK